MNAQGKPNLLVAALTGIALVAMIAAYFAPIWWVSLTAPNYPKDAFPDGIRIHFHFDGVYNGCKAAGKGTRMADEIIQKDLSHEDERYNPITRQGQGRRQGRPGPRLRARDEHHQPLRRHVPDRHRRAGGEAAGQVLLRLLRRPCCSLRCRDAEPRRLAVLAAGFAATAAWMLVDQYVIGHLEATSRNYIRRPAPSSTSPRRSRAGATTCATITTPSSPA
jgi:hypothetical protein